MIYILLASIFCIGVGTGMVISAQVLYPRRRRRHTLPPTYTVRPRPQLPAQPAAVARRTWANMEDW